MCGVSAAVSIRISAGSFAGQHGQIIREAGLYVVVRLRDGGEHVFHQTDIEPLEALAQPLRIDTAVSRRGSQTRRPGELPPTCNP